MIRAVCMPTDMGEFTAHFSERGLAGLDFPGRRDRSSLATPPYYLVSPESCRCEQLASMALHAALAGKPTAVLPPFDWRGATESQQSVWRAMLRIPPGRTNTYGE